MVKKVFGYSSSIQKSLCGKYLIVCLSTSHTIGIYDIDKEKVVKKYKLFNFGNILLLDNSFIIAANEYGILIMNLSDFNFERKIEIKEKGVSITDFHMCKSSRSDIFYFLCNFSSRKTGYAATYNYCKIFEINILKAEFKTVYYLKEEKDESVSESFEYKQGKLLRNMYYQDNKKRYMLEFWDRVKSKKEIASFSGEMLCADSENKFKTITVFTNGAYMENLQTFISAKYDYIENNAIGIYGKRNYVLEIFDEDFELMKNFKIQSDGHFSSYNSNRLSTSNKYLLLHFDKDVFIIDKDTLNVLVIVSGSYFSKTPYDPLTNDISGVLYDDLENALYISADDGTYRMDLRVTDELQVFKSDVEIDPAIFKYEKDKKIGEIQKAIEEFKKNRMTAIYKPAFEKEQNYIINDEANPSSFLKKHGICKELFVRFPDMEALEHSYNYIIKELNKKLPGKNYEEKIKELNETEKVIFEIQNYYNELYNGGLTQFLCNVYGDSLGRFIEVLEIIGAKKSVESMKKWMTDDDLANYKIYEEEMAEDLAELAIKYLKK